MNTFVIERPKGDQLVTWGHHPGTQHIRRQTEKAHDVALSVLLNTCYSSTDPNVVRAVTEFRAALELRHLFSEPQDTEMLDDETKPAE